MGEKGGDQMSTFTENYDFIKPGNEDFYDIQDFNENMDAIDAQLAQAEEKMAAVQAGIATAEETLAAINAKIGTPPSGQTMVSLLQNGNSIIRSIQHATYTPPYVTTTGSVTINPVNTAKTFVVCERLRNDYDSFVNYDYTLSSNAIAITHDNVSEPYRFMLGFWVVEFM